MSLSYAWQKINSALSCLVADSPLIRRLTYAGHELSQFPIQGLPVEVAQAALEAERAFTLWPNTPDFEAREGYCAALMEYLPESRRSMLPEKVIHLHQVVNEARGTRDAGVQVSAVPEGFELTSPHKWEFLFWNLRSDATREDRIKYTSYARHWLPNFPAEVLLEWQGRHGYDGMRHWAHLELEKLVFEEVLWSQEQLLNIQAVDHGFLDVGPNSHGGHHINRPGDWIGEYIRKHGTWSAPIIVIEHTASVSKGSNEVPVGLVLIEGHSRLSRMVNYVPANKTSSLHRVMLARLTE